jgi:carboxymethylenebutenolidase
LSQQVANKFVEFRCADGVAMPAYFVCPAEPGTFSGAFPGILFIYEAFGMNDEMRRLADSFAAEGFAVMIPDLFSRGTWFSCIRKLMADLKNECGRGVDDLLAAREWLVAQPEVDGAKTAVLGLCMGGGFALLLSKTGLFRVAAPFYGHVPASLKGACPIVASYGGKDLAFAPHFKRLKQEVKKESITADVKNYRSAGHSFMNKSPNVGLALLGKALPIHTGHNPKAEKDARKRVVKFLRTHLG